MCAIQVGMHALAQLFSFGREETNYFGSHVGNEFCIRLVTGNSVSVFVKAESIDQCHCNIFETFCNWL